MLESQLSDDRFTELFECIASLAVRSPMYRERSVALAEEFRSSIPKRERESLIGSNLKGVLANAIRSVGRRGKWAVVFSPEREFIFGDGFFHNLSSSVNGSYWRNPKIFVPLSPWLSVLFASPSSFVATPRLVTLVANSQEVEQLNFAIQVYSKNQIFYRSERPHISEAYKCKQHLIFKNDQNAIDNLIREIPGILRPDRTPYL